ncbi:MAG: glycosyltransferase family 4 protein [Rubrobacter sp.]|nr:glycosyltransferase family 4 protein [Rubrobacter sp.]
MRILFTVHQFFPEHFAGTEVLTLGLAKATKERGHEPFVLAAKRSMPFSEMSPYETEDYEYEGIPVRRVGRAKEGLARPYRFDYDNPRMAGMATEYARETSPDIVHAMHLQGLSAEVVPALKKLGLPVVYTATDFWSVCPVVDLMRHDGIMCRGPDIHHCPRCIMSRFQDSKAKKIMEATPDFALQTASRLSKTSFGNKVLPIRQIGEIESRPGGIRERVNLADKIIAPTRLTRELLLENGVGEGKITLSRYGIDTSNVADAPRNTNVPPPLRVGYIGTLGHHKGADILVKAFRRLPKSLDATLAIHGNPETFPRYMEDLKRLIAGDGRVRLAGTFPPAGIGAVLSNMDALVVPSRWYENTPLVVYSAFAAGTPVIATDLGGLSEVIGHDENGLLFPLEDDAELARQLRRLAEEPNLLQKLRGGIGHVKTIEENAAELEELYESLVRTDK